MPSKSPVASRRSTVGRYPRGENQRGKSACLHAIHLSPLAITIMASMTIFFTSIRTINCRIVPVGNEAPTPSLIFTEDLVTV